MYDDVLRRRSPDVKIDLKALQGKYREMQALFSELAKPATRVADEAANNNARAAATGIKATPTPLPAGTIIVQASSRLSGLIGRRGWTLRADGVMVAKLKTGTVEMRVEAGFIQVTSRPKVGDAVTFKEFDTLVTPYSSKPRSTRVMQAHHGAQNEAMARAFGKLGYDGGDAPTIWLRDSTGDSPHGVITHGMQNPNKAARLEDPDLTYGKIRDWAVSDLKAAGAPDDAIRNYLKHLDDYFAKNIEPKLKAKGKLALKGDIKVY
jgi:hypothetical protein